MPWTAWLLGAVVVLLAIALTWRIAVHRTTRGRRRALGAAAHGRSMEARAPALLEARGFTIVETHPQRSYVFTVNDVEETAWLRADLLVERDGARFVVEIKTGRAARPTVRGTRRQLLEYALHYAVDAVLLLDADRDVLTVVDFDGMAPEPSEDPPTAAPTGLSPTRLFTRGVVVGAACVGLLWIILR